jgi:hypothetical protein
LGKKGLFVNNKIKLFYPYLKVNENNRDVIAYLVGQMTQGFTDPQKDVFQNTMEKIAFKDNGRCSCTGIYRQSN